MKVALCFSGQFRNVRQTYEKYIYPYILEPNKQHQIDVFVHGWYDKNTAGQTFITSGGGIGSHPTPSNVLQDVYELYNPTTMLLQHQLPFDVRNYADRKYPAINPEFSLSKMYSIWSVNQLKLAQEQLFNFRYDVVATTRFDWAFLQPVPFNMVVNDGVYQSGLNPHGIIVGYNMGKSISIDHYANLFHNIQNLYDNGVVFCDEILAEAYLNRTGVPIHNFATPSTINRG